MVTGLDEEVDMNDDPTRSMRFYGALAAIIFAIAVPLMLGLLVAQDGTPRSVIGLLVLGIPINLAGVYFAVRAVADPRPETAARRLGIAWGIVAVGLVVMLGGNALLRM